MSDKYTEPRVKLTSEPAQKVPANEEKTELIRYGILFAILLPFLICIAFGFITFFTAVAIVIPPFIVALLLALLLDPVVDKLEKRGMNRAFSVALVFLVVFAVIVSASVIAIPAIISQATSLASNSAEYIQNTNSIVTVANKFLKAHPKMSLFHLPKSVDEHTVRVLSAKLTAHITSLLQTSSGAVAAMLVGSVSTVFDLVVTFIVGFYLLIDIDRLRARLFFLAPDRHRKKLAYIFQDIGQVFADYLRGLVTVCALYGLTTTVVLYAMAYFPKFGHAGMTQYALLIGAASGVLYALPYLGALSIALVTFLVALWAGGIEFALFSVAATLMINQVFDNIIVPRVIGGGVGLHPVMSIFAMSLGGYLWGFWGLLLSMPIAGSVQIVMFRLIPKLTKPTPRVIMEAHGDPEIIATTVEIKSSAAVQVTINKSETKVEVSPEPKSPEPVS